MTTQPAAPAMSPADIAAHQAASYVRAEPLPQAGQAAMRSLERKLDAQTGTRTAVNA